MADDRIMIRCDTCGGWKMLMKHFNGSLGTRDNGILAWLDAHGACHPYALHMDLQGVVGFSLHLEEKIGTELDPKLQNARRV